MASPARQGDKIRCDACPVMCYIAPGRSGACDRYANEDGELVRVDPLVIIEKTKAQGGELVPFLDRGAGLGRRTASPRRQFHHRRLERAPPTRTTSPRRSSCRARSRAST
jgi:hypothetical protein